ncbi:CDGSH iron-sulfur domain-containing protein [Streptomyces zagrosensis]|uniref:CDGSH-type Zn-finger protein n=1 Tax=Streptomyces zagrosensis TaxID=1042984 RepID=A0A7W9QH37_9ACTN|nr:CDGSH iron-sulfur domain-containing protein [Streptomyces zagrosensis]MBB5939909.1 CDGSH-type Zn-finger protein [Streptomyces zagrosensis]
MTAAPRPGIPAEEPVAPPDAPLGAQPGTQFDADAGAGGGTSDGAGGGARPGAPTSAASGAAPQDAQPTRVARPTRVVIAPDGPLLIEGPVEVEWGDGRIARSDRPQVALCVCRRSRSFPWCDTSHRRKEPRQRGEAQN